ncbi:GNAT family N-acetyltransferase [Roseobacter sinensis]|uniref:GNAT family N-acetyltransferase n=1 Tax=Roseobacter sinensis TaxID=2931391 RepID=A0ABT3BA72_9RHOB|nr:GNAT family N-acetyltransferase [Roseobacter sp. WL0113]MCV3270471.1 GNAT family N-acetyltransferase [Roseobacter sp. WL0113]
MSLTFRPATREEVADVIALLQDDVLGAAREGLDLAEYEAAFDRMYQEAANHLIVGLQAGRIVATYQLTFISGLSLRAARRAQIESVRVASDQRGQGIGQAMIEDAVTRAKDAGCSLIQLTMNKSRTDSARFYEGLGFTPSHIGYKRSLI